MPNAAGECNSRVAGRIDTRGRTARLDFRRHPLVVPACGNLRIDQPRHRAARFAGFLGVSRPQRGNGAFGERKPAPHF